MPVKENSNNLESSQSENELDQDSNSLQSFDGKLSSLSSERNSIPSSESNKRAPEPNQNGNGPKTRLDSNKPYKFNPNQKKPSHDKPDNQTTQEQNIILPLSKSLIAKLRKLSKAEGLSLESFAAELIAEGTVLRAWEILERKNHIRDSGNTHSNNNNNSYNNNNRRNNRNDNPRHSNNKNNNNNNNNGHRSMNKSRYNSIMDDKANFLEYVRNQEKYNR